ALCLVPFVLARRKEPSATIAWILVLVFVPPLGAILFLLFGRDRVRWPAKRKRAQDAVVRAQVAASSAEDAAPQVELDSALERSLFRIGGRLAHWRATAGNRVEVLVDGNSTYERIG